MQRALYIPANIAANNARKIELGDPNRRFVPKSKRKLTNAAKMPVKNIGNTIHHRPAKLVYTPSISGGTNESRRKYETISHQESAQSTASSTVFYPETEKAADETLICRYYLSIDFPVYLLTEYSFQF
jgi:hypothetical protein